jgi:hypothetical protein
MTSLKLCSQFNVTVKMPTTFNMVLQHLICFKASNSFINNRTSRKTSNMCLCKGKDKLWPFLGHVYIFNTLYLIFFWKIGNCSFLPKIFTWFFALSSFYLFRFLFYSFSRYISLSTSIEFYLKFAIFHTKKQKHFSCLFKRMKRSKWKDLNVFLLSDKNGFFKELE